MPSADEGASRSCPSVFSLPPGFLLPGQAEARPVPLSLLFRGRRW